MITESSFILLDSRMDNAKLIKNSLKSREEYKISDKLSAEYSVDIEQSCCSYANCNELKYIYIVGKIVNFIESADLTILLSSREIRLKCAFMRINELDSSIHSKAFEIQKKKIEISLRKEKGINTFNTCPRCKGTDTTVQTMQLKAADEGSTDVLKCNSCGYKR